MPSYLMESCLLSFVIGGLVGAFVALELAYRRHESESTDGSAVPVPIKVKERRNKSQP